MLLNTWFGLLQLLFIKGCLSKVAVEVSPKELLALPHQNVTFLCRVAVKLQYCRIVIPGIDSLNLSPGSKTEQLSYYGSGLDVGHCGFTLQNVQEINNGDITCFLGLANEVKESSQSMHLTVARAPRSPILDIHKSSDGYWAYKVGDVLRATCVVRDGRPVANITWYLDDEEIPYSQLSPPTIENGKHGDLLTIHQNLTKELRPSDNGKSLKCVSNHPAITDSNVSFRQLNVTYPPLQQPNPIDKFGYALGQDGIITLEIEANPKPHLEWSIRDQRIKEGGHDSTGRIKAEEVLDLGRGRYQAALVIANINKQDTEAQYILSAYNDQGSQDYVILISTSAEPEDLELGVLSIIGIVIAVLVLLLVVFLVIFARVTGRWCFSGVTVVRHTGESSDTESVDVRTRNFKNYLPNLKLTSLFKKKQEPEEEERSNSAETVETKIPIDENKQTTTPESKEGIVYAELDLINPNSKPLLKHDDDKTEYAEIVYNQKEEETKKDETKTNK